MSFERVAYQPMMPYTVVRSTRTGHTSYGAAAYSTVTTSYRARVVDKSGFVRNQQGEDVAFRTIAWVASTGRIDMSDRITLPDGTSPPIVAVERYPDQDGTHHSKIMLGW